MYLPVEGIGITGSVLVIILSISEQLQRSGDSNFALDIEYQ